MAHAKFCWRSAPCVSVPPRFAARRELKRGTSGRFAIPREWPRVALLAKRNAQHEPGRPGRGDIRWSLSTVFPSRYRHSTHAKSLRQASGASGISSQPGRPGTSLRRTYRNLANRMRNEVRRVVADRLFGRPWSRLKFLRSGAGGDHRPAYG